MLDMEEELLSPFEPIEGDTLNSRSDSDSPIIEIEKRLSGPRVRRPVSPIITADTREVRLIQFAGGCYSLLTEWSELPVLNALIDSAPGDTAELNYSPAWRLAVGDLVLFRAGGDKGFIRLLAEEHLGTVQYENVRELAESWKPALRSLGRNLDEVQRQLVKVGLHRTDPTVSAWLNNPDRIGPGQADDIEYIARAVGNEDLLSNLTNVAEAISQIRGSHIVAGRSLTQQARWEAVQQAKSRGLSLRAIARELGMSRVATRKYALGESPPTKLLSVKERAKAEALAQVQMAAD